MIEKLKKLDIKWWIIFILAGILIFNIMCQKPNKIDIYKDENKKIQKQNELLLKRNDSIDKENSILNKRITEAELRIAQGVEQARQLQVDINNLETKRNEINNHVKHLDANGVARELSEYIRERRKSINRK